MPRVNASATARTDPGTAWAVLQEPNRWAPLAPHVRAVDRPSAGRTAWDVLLNGSRCRWVQRESAQRPGLTRFEKVHGDVVKLHGNWSVRETPAGIVIALDLEFDLGVDGLAPLLNPIWTQSFQAHADALVRAVAAACTSAHAVKERT